MNIAALAFTGLITIGLLVYLASLFVRAFREIHEYKNASHDTNFYIGLFLIIGGFAGIVVLLAAGGVAGFVGAIASLGLLWIGVSLPYGFKVRRRH